LPRRLQRGEHFEFWYALCYRRGNHPRQTLYQSVQRFWSSDIPNFPTLIALTAVYRAGFRHRSYARLILKGIWVYLKIRVLVSRTLSRTLNLADFWATVCKTVRPVRPMLSDCCLSCPVLSCLFVCNVGVLWRTVGWIKMKLGMPVDLGAGHIVLDGDRAPPPPKGRSPPIIGTCLLWPNGCMDQDATRYGGRPRPRRRCVRWRPSSPPQKGGGAPLPNYRPMSVVAKRLDASRCHFLWR